MHLKRTKIIATQWPATFWKEKLKWLYNAWVNVVRFNFSHANYEVFSENMANIKELNESWNTNLSTLLDTKWPEIRTKTTNEILDIQVWEEFYITSLDKEKNIDKQNTKLLVCDYEYIVLDVEIWKIIDIDSWLLKAEVIWKDNSKLICKALNWHKVTSKRHINLPWTKIKLPWITEEDKKDILFWIKQGFDFIALSFVRNKENLSDLKIFLKENNAWFIKIISKIESEEALENIDEIIEKSHWIMIARWDLWSEIPFETLPMVQKMIAEKCKTAWKFFIVATQMLETMITNPIPTRAEVTDIFNAAIQEADATMLSWETAAWSYPIESVIEMSKILNFTESQIKYNHSHFTRDIWKENDKKMLIKNAINLSEDLKVKAMLVFTNNWFVATTAAAFRPNVPVFTFSFDEKTRKSLNIYFWLTNFVIEKWENDTNIKNAIEKLIDKWLILFWDKIIVIFDKQLNDKIIPTIEVISI